MIASSTAIWLSLMHPNTWALVQVYYSQSQF